MKNELSEVEKKLQNGSQTIVYVDYQNISDLLKSYGTDPQEINLFRVIQDNLKQSGLNVIDCIAYGDFEKNPESAKEQTYLRHMGFQTRHSANHGKNSSDLELTVDALRVLYKNPNIHTFVFISSERDLFPLLKAIKYENKRSYVLTTKTGFNRIVAEYADYHEYMEDIFNLTEKELETIKTPTSSAQSWDFNSTDINETAIARAREVSEYFYRSNIWKKYTIFAEPINLQGYINVISKIVHRTPDEILNDFKVAHHMKYVTLYNQSQQLYIKQGSEKDTLFLKTG
ncbi:MAG TPA: NYN domain-containing protein [Bacillota bacterium]|nr:NYN domain-containing protein [Bacillota bacterium]